MIMATLFVINFRHNRQIRAKSCSGKDLLYRNNGGGFDPHAREKCCVQLSVHWKPVHLFFQSPRMVYSLWEAARQHCRAKLTFPSTTSKKMFACVTILVYDVYNIMTSCENKSGCRHTG